MAYEFTNPQTGKMKSFFSISKIVFFQFYVKSNKWYKWKNKKIEAQFEKKCTTGNQQFHRVRLWPIQSASFTMWIFCDVINIICAPYECSIVIESERGICALNMCRGKSRAIYFSVGHRNRCWWLMHNVLYPSVVADKRIWAVVWNPIKIRLSIVLRLFVVVVVDRI